MNEKFSVLLSLYFKEKPQNVRECFESLISQTATADEWVIVEDGPLTEELYAVLDEYENKYPDLIKRVPLKENQGLGRALNEGIKHCKNELVARMDTDDIAVPTRFEKQLEMFKNNPKLDICGSHIKEFTDTPDIVTSIRKVPLNDGDIKEYQKRRDAFNHMTVMYKKSTVLKAGNYQHALLMEDTLLWVNMILSGAVCANVDDYLVYARTGKDMFMRRGGFAYFKKYKSGRKKVYDTGYISLWDYYVTLLIQFVVALIPNKLRKFVFEKMLRN